MPVYRRAMLLSLCPHSVIMNDFNEPKHGRSSKLTIHFILIVVLGILDDIIIGTGSLVPFT